MDFNRNFIKNLKLKYKINILGIQKNVMLSRAKNFSFHFLRLRKLLLLYIELEDN